MADFTAMTEFIATSDIPVLDSILSILNSSGLVNSIIDLVLLNPELLDMTIDTTIWIIRERLINLTDLFIAIQKSGLIIDILRLSLEDPDILPGLLRIGMELLRQSGINIFGKRDFEFEVESPSSFPEEISSSSAVVVELNKRESELLNSVFQSLRDSGLAVSVVQHILTTPELAGPNAHFLLEVLRSNSLPIGDLFQALKESNLIWNLLRDILGDPSVLREFGSIIADRLLKGLIPINIFEAASAGGDVGTGTGTGSAAAIFEAALGVVVPVSDTPVTPVGTTTATTAV